MATHTRTLGDREIAKSLPRLAECERPRPDDFEDREEAMKPEQTRAFLDVPFLVLCAHWLFSSQEKEIVR
jgi:hypothetical protein